MLDQLLRRSDLMMRNMQELLSHPLYDNRARFGLSYEYALLSLEHAAGVRCLLEGGLMSSAPVLLRCQFEALLRAMWVLYCAQESELDKLEASLQEGPDKANASLPQAFAMLPALEAVPQVSNAAIRLREFHASSWKPLNSFVHAGDHPLWRQASGYPPQFGVAVLQQSNGLAIMAGMQQAILTGVNGLQASLLSLDTRFRDCLPKHDQPNDGTPSPPVP